MLMHKGILWFVLDTQDRSVETKYHRVWGMELVFSELGIPRCCFGLSGELKGKMVENSD